MPDVKGLNKVVALLRAKAAKASKANEAKVAVGYSANYAVHVHENLEVFHKNGQAKFLEQPAREHRAELFKVIKEELKSGRTMAQALIKAGLLLQRLSQQLVPVDTGNLKNSAFTRLEGGE